MNTGTILIPKLSTLTKDMEIYSNTDKFFVVAGYKPSSETSCVSKSSNMNKDNRLKSVFRTLKNSVFKNSRTNYNLIEDDEFRYTLFSSETRAEIRERKKTLVQIINRHERALLALREARMKCWKSKDKLEQYKLSLETQKSALVYNQDEKKPRTAAIKLMQVLLEKRARAHEKDCIDFETKFLAELNLREKMNKISHDLEADIVDIMVESVKVMMTNKEQVISETDIRKLAHQIYCQTSRSYKFSISQNIPCQKVWIEKPQYENSELNGAIIKRKMKQVYKFSPGKKAD